MDLDPEQNTSPPKPANAGTAPMKHFQLRPLELKRLIRLLTRPEFVNQDGPIECSITTHELVDGRFPEYTALSYTWGQEEPSIHIYIDNDKVLKVTPNLRSALRHLRSRDSSLLLWVDAICINQDDPTEKSWQVSIMRTFYASSCNTFIWLGSAWDNHRKGLQIARIMARAEEVEMRDGRINAASDLKWDLADEEQAKGSLNPVTGSVWNTEFNNLIRRPWFKRVWVSGHHHVDM